MRKFFSIAWTILRYLELACLIFVIITPSLMYFLSKPIFGMEFAEYSSVDLKFICVVLSAVGGLCVGMRMSLIGCAATIINYIACIFLYHDKEINILIPVLFALGVIGWLVCSFMEGMRTRTLKIIHYVKGISYALLSLFCLTFGTGFVFVTNYFLIVLGIFMSLDVLILYTRIHDDQETFDALKEIEEARHTYFAIRRNRAHDELMSNSNGGNVYVGDIQKDLDKAQDKFDNWKKHH